MLAQLERESALTVAAGLAAQGLVSLCPSQHQGHIPKGPLMTLTSP